MAPPWTTVYLQGASECPGKCIRRAGRSVQQILRRHPKGFPQLRSKGDLRCWFLFTIKSHRTAIQIIFFFFSIIQVALKACPYRADFFAKLKADPAGGPPASDDQLNEGLSRWLAALDGIVTRVQSFYRAGGHDKGF